MNYQSTKRKEFQIDFAKSKKLIRKDCTLSNSNHKTLWRNNTEIKIHVMHAWQPEFYPQNPYNGGRCELTPQRCPVAHGLKHTHTHTDDDNI